MKRLPSRLDLFNSVFFTYATVALLAAAALVIYLQHQALTAQDAQTSVILRKISEQAALAVESEIRRVFDGPVLETVTAVSHADVMEGRVDLIADQFARGTRDYPHVERFFVWTADSQSIAPDEVVFYGPAPRADRGVTPQPERDGRLVGAWQYFYRDAAWGRRIYRFGQQGSATQQVYVTAERVVEGTNYDFFVRLYWTDASRDRVLAMMGFIVNLADVRTRLFPELHRRQLARVLNPAEGSPHLEMEILDEAGRPVFATGESSGSLTPRRTLDMRFYPARSIRTRLVSEIPRRDWTLRVGPTVASTSSALAPIELRGYWLAAVSVLLMLTGLAFAVRGYTHERRLAQSQADFIAHASHQLKTPLTLLNGVCETLLLERARSPERQAQYLDIMRTGTARLTALVERILEFSRVLEGGRRYEMERVEVSSLVREIVDAFRSGFSPEEVEITVETDGSALICRKQGFHWLIVIFSHPHFIRRYRRFRNDAQRISFRMR
jgi:signal transduction histidine kinase